MEEISCLEPGQSAKRHIQVRFHHHLLPMRLSLHYNGKKVPVKLRPDLGYLVKPFPIPIEEFLATESRLPGMFEYSRRLQLFLFLIITSTILIFSNLSWLLVGARSQIMSETQEWRMGKTSFLASASL